MDLRRNVALKNIVRNTKKGAKLIGDLATAFANNAVGNDIKKLKKSWK